MIISFTSSDEIRTMRTKSDNIETMVGNETNEFIEGIFESVLQKFQKRIRITNERK